MEITTHTRDLLVLEDKHWVGRVFVLAVGGAGILLLLSSMKEYGPQAWYRLTHWMGALLAVGAALVYVRTVFTIRLEVSKLHNKIRISRLRGLRWEEIRQAQLSDFTDIRIERKSLGARILYRLAIRLKEEWVPVQHGFSLDFTQVEQAGKAVQRIFQAG